MLLTFLPERLDWFGEGFQFSEEEIPVGPREEETACWGKGLRATERVPRRHSQATFLTLLSTLSGGDQRPADLAFHLPWI